MFRQRLFALSATRITLSAAVLAYSCVLFAQAGAGGGHVGGGVAGGGGLSGRGGGGASGGVDMKDDLKNFHATMAVQATSHQIVDYSLMLKSTEAASLELQGFQEQLARQSDRLQLTAQGAAVDQAIEKARTQSQKYLDSFSEQQKSGLKETVRKLLKEDADLGQQSRALGLELNDQKVSVQLISNSAQNLDQTLANFRSRQLELGNEMSIAASDHADSTFNLSPVKNSITFGDQLVSVATSGAVSPTKPEQDRYMFTLQLNEDLSDLQQNLTAVLRSQLDKSERCGEHIEIYNATLSPLASASLVTVQLHFERWMCMGGQNMNEMAEGNGTIELKLTPSIDKEGALQFNTYINRVDAEGMLGDLLRSGALGDEFRGKVAEVLLSVARDGSDIKTILPPAAQGHAVFTHAQFEGTGLERLNFVVAGEINLSSENAKVLTGELQGKSPSAGPPPTAVAR
jgi:hypothetical protein